MQLKHETALADIQEFFDYILSFAETYKTNSDETIKFFNIFISKLQQDKTNFMNDADWLNSTAVVKTSSEINETFTTIYKIQAQYNITNKKLDEIHREINGTINKMVNDQYFSMFGTGMCQLFCYQTVVRHYSIFASNLLKLQFVSFRGERSEFKQNFSSNFKAYFHWAFFPYIYRV